MVIEADDTATDEPDYFGVWPENAETVNVFRALETQWNVVSGKVGLIFIGLRYEALREVWKRLGVKRKRRDEVYRGLRDMELAALPVLNERRGA